MYKWFTRQRKNAGLPTLWFMGLWLTHAGKLAAARDVRAELALRAGLGNDATARYFERSITARLALQAGDTAAARSILAAMRPHADATSLQWTPWESESADRLLLAEVELAQKHYAAAAVAAGFADASAPVTAPIFLRRSLEIRIAAATALGDDVEAASLRRRLQSLAGRGGS
jgi:hypothetical protein